MKTITVPTESVVTFNKNGIVKIEHVRTATIELTQEIAEAFLRLMGTTAEEAVEACTKIEQEAELHG